MPKSYANNAYNRSVGRVGMPMGSCVISRGSSGGGGGGGGSSSRSSGGSYGGYSSGYTASPVSYGSSTGGSSSTKSYVDNAYNRSVGRVGMPVGSCVISKGSSAGGGDSGFLSERSATSGDGVKVYVDNSLNRKLGRVDKPVGSMVYSRKSRDPDGQPSVSRRTYVDNAANRRLGRVGKELGSQPNSRKSRDTQEKKHWIEKIKGDDDLQLPGQDYSDFSVQYPDTNYTAHEKINFQEIELGRKIGQGGFGDVFSATWRNTTVAVKKLRVQRVSKRRLQEFTAEVLKFCQLDHPSIVKFIGACVVTPNLAIVMEKMQTNLFDALHLDDNVDFSDEARWSILRQTTFGLSYLHEKKIAHCDLKSQNVMLNDVTDENVVAKITDFGLSMVKNDTETSQPQGPEELVRNVGTPRYSAPEVLRGELLSVKSMMQADIYSLALIIYEVMIEQEPYYDMNYAQLRKQVGDGGRKPDIPDGVTLDEDLEKVMKACWHFDPHKRPDVEEVLGILN